MEKHSYKKGMIIYNPESGQGIPLSPVFKDILGIKYRKLEVPGGREEYLEKARAYLGNYGIKTDIAKTKAAGHAVQIAKDCVEQGYDLVIAAGGDGTINEVVNGLAYSETVLGVIPMGTVNVLALELHLPVELEDACKVIASGNVKRIDLGKGKGRYFVCVAGIGFDAHVLKEVDSRLKKIYGAMAYIVVGLSKILTYKFRQIVIKIDEQPLRRKGYFVFISNGKYYGGKIVLTSQADMADGYLDVCIFKHKNLFSVAGYLFGLSRGDIGKYLNVEYFQGRKISVLKKGKHPVHVDAEYLCETPVEFEVCPKALKVAV